MDSTTNILVVDRPKGWLRHVGDWGRRNNIEVTHCAEQDRGLTELRNEKYACRVVNVSFTGLAVFEDPKQGRQPWIVVSDEPWLEAAVRAVEISARAYLHEPIQAEVLIEKIGAALAWTNAHRTVHVAKHEEVQQQFHRLMNDLAQSARPCADTPARHFVDLTMRNLLQAAWDMRQVSLGALGNRSEQSVCHLFNCPRLSTLTEALRESIRVLERTKSAFKSQDLAELRKRLQALMELEEQRHE